ncbi:MAG: AMP-binding protein [Rectinemataceae bacterium]|nr:AMP-binding protein [Rectinemataceae bacterium]
MYELTDYTFPEIIEKSTVRYADRPVFGMVGGRTVTYGELGAKTLRVAGILQAYGLAKGDRVAILSESSPAWGISYLGTTRTGIILVPILTDFTPEQIANILEHAGAKAIMVSRRFLAKVDSESTRRILLAVEDTGFIAGPKGTKVLTESDIREAIQNFKVPLVAADDTLEIVYTSGTTGLSKGVMLSHRNIISNAIACRSIIILHRLDRLLSILPLAHTYEFTIGFTIPLLAGSAMYYMDKPPSATALLPALKTVRPTIMLSVPLVIEKICRSSVKPALEAIKLYQKPFFKPILEFLAGIKLKNTFGGHIRFFGVGGAPLSPDVEKLLKTARFPYAIGYGLTETSPLLAGCNPAKTRLGSTGPALKGVSIRIADPRPDSREGEIQAKGPNIFKGYFNDPIRTREAFTEDGWFKTGDLGFVDTRGKLFVRGRLKNMILGASGENIYPEEVEAVINSSPYVNESLVYGDESGLTALIHLKPEVWENLEARLKDSIEGAGEAASRLGHAVTDAEKTAEKTASQILDKIKKEANERLAAFSRIGKVKIQKEPFEKTPTQKIKRFLYPKKE